MGSVAPSYFDIGVGDHPLLPPAPPAAPLLPPPQSTHSLCVLESKMLQGCGFPVLQKVYVAVILPQILTGGLALWLLKGKVSRAAKA
jgi:hypothetical protein